MTPFFVYQCIKRQCEASVAVTLHSRGRLFTWFRPADLFQASQTILGHSSPFLWPGRWLVPPYKFGPLWVVCAFCVCCAGSMNSLPGRAALSLCRRTAAGGMKLLAGSPAHPAAGLAASVPAVRVCHSGPSSKSSVNTKKRGYDITRNPQLNKVRALVPLIFSFSPLSSRAGH